MIKRIFLLFIILLILPVHTFADCEKAFIPCWFDEDAELIAKTVYGEARGEDKLGQSAVVWCILNRVDESGKSIEQIIKAKGQFHGYKRKNPVTDEILWLVNDVLTRWQLEHEGGINVGRTLPKEFTFFRARGKINVFRDAYKGEYTEWDWSLPNPYEENSTNES